MTDSEVKNLTEMFTTKYSSEFPALHITKVRVMVDSWKAHDNSGKIDYIITSRFWTDKCTSHVAVRIRTNASSINEVPEEEILKHLERTMRSIRSIIEIEYPKHS